MKRFVSILAALMMLAGLVSAGAEGTATVSYDFDVRFSMEEQEVPYRMRERMRAYRDLVNMLELKGNIIWNPAIWGMDLRMELIPVTNPSAAIALRIFGRGSSICVESPLLGEEPYYLGQTSRIMGFFSQLWVTLGIPFPSFFLLDPFIVPYSLEKELEAWRAAFPNVSAGQVITAGTLEQLRDTWQDQLQNDDRLISWLNGFYAMAMNPELAQQAAAELPETLVKAAGGGDLTIREKDGTLRCENAEGESFFEIRNGERSCSVEFAPPDTGAKYLPYCRFSRSEESGTKSLTLKATLNRNDSGAKDTADEPGDGESGPGSEEYEYENPASMLQFSLETEGIPAVWPAKGTMTADLSMGGYALPEANLRFLLETAQDGSAVLTVSEAREDGSLQKVLTCSGSVTQVPYEGEELYYEYGDLFEHTLLLVATHDWATEALGQIVPYMAQGMIKFVYELPVRSCQVLLDDLEKLGLLGAVLAGD